MKQKTELILNRPLKGVKYIATDYMSGEIGEDGSPEIYLMYVPVYINDNERIVQAHQIKRVWAGGSPGKPIYYIVPATDNFLSMKITNEFFEENSPKAGDYIVFSTLESNASEPVYMDATTFNNTYKIHPTEFFRPDLENPNVVSIDRKSFEEALRELNREVSDRILTLWRKCSNPPSVVTSGANATWKEDVK